MRELSSDETLRCIVLRGAGEKAFSPGADISEFSAHRSNRRQAREYGALIQKAMQSIRDCQHPVIAMIQGVCVGGGLELASMCDLRICGESSRFGVPVNRIAITMAYPEIRALIDLVGRATALEILLEGRVFGALEAKIKGLVTRVVPDGEVEEEAYASARRIADGAPLANRLHKRFAYRLLDPKPLTEAEVDQGFEIVGTEDHREGIPGLPHQDQATIQGPLTMNRQPTSNRTGPLLGMKVLEASHVMAGPTCGLMLADLGADVVKVERLPGGDDTRRAVPPEIQGESAAFMMMNRNKRGIGLNLKSEKGREVFRRLAGNSDVVIENFRKGTMEALGLGYDRLKSDNPGLIYCSLSGFGQTGPYADRGGFDLIAQGMSGLMSITGEGPGQGSGKGGGPHDGYHRGHPGGPGDRCGLCSPAAYRRGTTGGHIPAGGRNRSHLLAVGHFSGDGCLPRGNGIGPSLMAPYQSFETRDGWVNIGAANQANWERLLGRSRSFRTGTRSPIRRQCRANASPGCAGRAVDSLFSISNHLFMAGKIPSRGIPAGPVLSIAAMHADPQVKARRMVTEVPHSRLGQVKTLGAPVKFSATSTSLTRGAPAAGRAHPGSAARSRLQRQRNRNSRSRRSHSQRPDPT